MEGVGGIILDRVVGSLWNRLLKRDFRKVYKSNDLPRSGLLEQHMQRIEMLPWSIIDEWSYFRCLMGPVRPVSLNSGFSKYSYIRLVK